MIKISNTKKMGSVFSWSTQAGHPSEGGSCPASFDASGNYVDACQGCYAREGNYRFSNVKKVRQHNQQDWKRKNFANEMIEYIDLNCRYFRWFDSGDMYHVKLAEKIYEICKATPHCKHWIPTRQYKFQKFSSVIERLNSLPNVVVRFSSDSVIGHTVRGRNTSTIAPNFHIKSLPKSFTKCNAQDQEGQCKSCRHCWDKKNKCCCLSFTWATHQNSIKNEGINTMKKPKTNKVLVTHPDGKSFYEGAVESLLSVQFTANYKDEKGNECFGFYFYNDRNDTWKDFEEQD